jgi:hypothetical protein
VLFVAKRKDGKYTEKKDKEAGRKTGNILPAKI